MIAALQVGMNGNIVFKSGRDHRSQLLSNTVLNASGLSSAISMPPCTVATVLASPLS